MRTAVIGLVLLGLCGCSGAAPPDQPPVPSVPSGPGAQAIMRFRPTWLPVGLREVERVVNPSSGFQSRTFSTLSDVRPRPSVVVTVSTTSTVQPMNQDSTTVDVNGVPGRMEVPSYTSFFDAIVEWSPEPGVQMSVVVDELPDVAGVALRVARSTIPDASPMFGADPMRVGWLPGGKTLDTLYVRGKSPAGWSASQLTTGDVELRNDSWPCQGENLVEVPVRSTVGWYFHDTSMKQPRSKVFVPLEAGRCLVVSGHKSREELIRVAESIQLQPIDTAWVGAGQ